jgi:hypothetical protein
VSFMLFVVNFTASKCKKNARLQSNAPR